jgi:hypothetical protein
MLINPRVSNFFPVGGIPSHSLNSAASDLGSIPSLSTLRTTKTDNSSLSLINNHLLQRHSPIRGRAMDFLRHGNETGEVGGRAGIRDWDDDIGGADFGERRRVDFCNVDPGDEIGGCFGEFSAVGHWVGKEMELNVL